MIDKGKEILAQQGEAFVKRVGSKVKNAIERSSGTNVNEIAEVAQAIAPQVSRRMGGAANHIAEMANRHMAGRELASRQR